MREITYEKVDRKTTFDYVLEKYPLTEKVFLEMGLRCIKCPLSRTETIEEGCLVHGLNPDKLVEKINEAIKNESIKELKEYKQEN